MLAMEPLSGYGLRKRIGESVGHFWQESYGQIYPTLRRLAAEGLAEARPAPRGPGRGATVYRPTARGRAELAAWLRRPPVFEPQRNELLLKLFFGGAAPPEASRAHLEAAAAEIRSQIAALEAIDARFESGAVDHPDAAWWRLTLDFGLTMTRAALNWAERSLAAVQARAPGARAAPPAAHRGRPAPAARSR
jgi:DNA-binding PadR family transcriptional regulator